MGLGTRGLGDAGMQGCEDSGTRGRGDRGTRGRGDAGTRRRGDVGTWDSKAGLGMWDVGTRGRDKQTNKSTWFLRWIVKYNFSVLSRKILYLSFSSWAGGIQQILQFDWFLEREEFSRLEHPSGRNPSGWSIFVNELAVILNLLPFLHFHRRLINASLSLFAFRWQRKSP